MLEQVSVYDCPIEDLEALEIAKANKQMAIGFDSSFQKLGHGLSCMRKPSEFLMDLIEKIEVEQAEEAAKKAEEEAAAVALAAEEVAATRDQKPSITPGGEEGRKSQSASIIQLKEENNLSMVGSGCTDEKKSSRMQSTQQQVSRNGSLLQGELGIDKTGDKATQAMETPSSSEGSSAQTSEGEEHLLVVHEFSRVGRLEATVKHRPLAFLDSVDVVKVEKHMLSLLGYPGEFPRRYTFKCIITILEGFVYHRWHCFNAIYKTMLSYTQRT